MLNDKIAANRFWARPLYLQVRDVIAQRIAGGDWKPNTTIPNESDLAREFGVSPGTMRKALDLAEAERLLVRRQGRGTFVNDQSSDEHAERYNNVCGRDGNRIRGKVKVLSIVEAVASERECRRLRLSGTARVHRIRRLRVTYGTPYMLEEVAMPAALFPGLASTKDACLRVAALAQQFGVLLGRGQERITVGSATPDVASALQVAPGTTIMLLDRVICTLEGTPAEWRLAQCVAASRHYLAELK